MVLLFFKVFSSMVSTLALKPLVKALLALWLRHLQNMGFERFNSISADENRWARIFCLMCGNKIRCQVRAARRMTHQFDVFFGQKDADLNRCVEVRIVMMNNDSCSHVCFSNFSQEIVVYTQNSPSCVAHMDQSSYDLGAIVYFDSNRISFPVALKTRYYY